MEATVLERLENEQEHSAWLERLLEALYGKGWNELTVFEARKHQKRVEKLEGWLKYLWGRGHMIDEIDAEIDAYIKAMETKA